jgi:hypothetical protein
MSYHIKRPNQLMPSIDVYYVTDNRWSDDYTERKVFGEDPSSMLSNPDGKNGGFKNAIIVTE